MSQGLDVGEAEGGAAVFSRLCLNTRKYQLRY